MKFQGQLLQKRYQLSGRERMKAERTLRLEWKPNCIPSISDNTELILIEARFPMVQLWNVQNFVRKMLDLKMW